MEASGCHLCDIPLPHSRSLVSARKKLEYMFDVAIFVAATQGMPLDHLSLETRGLYSCVLQDCNNQREFLQVYHSQGTVHVAD